MAAGRATEPGKPVVACRARIARSAWALNPPYVEAGSAVVGADSGHGIMPLGSYAMIDDTKT